MYYIYILRCLDGSLYTGITNHLKRRMYEHFHQTAKCAKYTLSHPVSHLEALWCCDSRKDASRLEYRIKQLTKLEKEKLIQENQLVRDKIDLSLYQRIEDMTF